MGGEPLDEAGRLRHSAQDVLVGNTRRVFFASSRDSVRAETLLVALPGVKWLVVCDRAMKMPVRDEPIDLFCGGARPVGIGNNVVDVGTICSGCGEGAKGSRWGSFSVLFFGQLR